MTQLVLDTKLSNEQRELVETVRTSGASLLTVINDILDYSRVESNRLVLDQRPFSMEQVRSRG